MHNNLIRLWSIKAVKKSQSKKIGEITCGKEENHVKTSTVRSSWDQIEAVLKADKNLSKQSTYNEWLEGGDKFDNSDENLSEVVKNGVEVKKKFEAIQRNN